MKPLLLIDVDGVLNPYKAHRCPEGFVEHEYYDEDGSSYDIRLNPEHAAWLAELAEVFELVWATTWEHKANEFIAPNLSLPQLPVIEFDQGATGYNRTWKLVTIVEYIGDRPAAWIDDELFRDAKLWAQDRGDTLLVSPNPGIGMDRSHVEKLLRWATSLAR